jgi:hypothetical protein
MLYQKIFSRLGIGYRLFINYNCSGIDAYEAVITNYRSQGCIDTIAKIHYDEAQQAIKRLKQK